MVNTDQWGHLFLHADGVGPNPHGQSDHTGLIHDVVVQARADVDAHRPDLLVLRITIGIDLRLRIASVFTSTVVTPARGSTAAGPVHAGHVKIDVIRNLDVGVVLLHPVIRPNIAASLSTFFTRPQTEHHGVSRVVVGHGLGYGEHHGCSSRVVVSAHARAVRSTEDVRVKETTVHGRSDVKVGAKHHPLIGVHLAKAITADVVGFWILLTGHHGVVGEALRDDLKSETFQRKDQVLGSVFVSSISLSGPSVEVPHCSVGEVGRVGRFVGHVPDVVEHGQSVDHARGVPSSNRFIVGRRHRSFHWDSKSEHRSTVVGRNLNGVCGAVFTLDSNDAVVG